MAAKRGLDTILPTAEGDPEKSFQHLQEDYRVLAGIIASCQTEDRRLSTQRLGFETTKTEVNEALSKAEGEEVENLRKRLSTVESELQANAEAISRNAKAEEKANKDAADLRAQLEKPLRELAPAGAPAAAESSAAKILRTAGITKLSLKCEKTKDLARRTTDDTWIQLMLLGCTPKARDFIEEQRWEDCEEIVEAATTRYLPHREEAHHIFAKACPGAEMGTRHFSCLVLLYKLAKLKVHDGILPQEPPDASQMQQTMPQNLHFSPGGSTTLVNQAKFRGDSHEVEEQITMDPDHKDILLIKAIYETERLKSL